MYTSVQITYHQTVAFSDASEQNALANNIIYLELQVVNSECIGH